MVKALKKALVITGASRGIGLATAVHFADQGWQVTSLARTRCPDKRINSILTDLANQTALQGAFREMDSLLQEKSVICLVHNAACHFKDAISAVCLESLREALEVNVIAPMLLNQWLIPCMSPGSSILYMGSTLSEKAVREAATYVVSKHASAGMMRATCQDLAGTGIHTACICPGFTETEMLKNHLMQADGIRHHAIEMSCFSRLISPEEIAAMVYFSAVSPVLNGALLHANLGQIER